MIKICSLFRFTDKDMQELQSVCMKKYIQYTVIPSLSAQLEDCLNGLNFKNVFPAKTKKTEIGKDFLTEFYIVTPDELKNYESSIRLKERLKMSKEKK